MKYIRTENGVFERDKCKTTLWKMHVIKESDTIEELFDAIVYKATSVYDDKSIFTGIQYPPFDIKDSTNIISAKGAIWTEWGLKYVAKMKGILHNGEINRELL